MKRYNVSALRQNLAQALGEAERGDDVVVERRGVRFRLVPEARAGSRSRRAAFFDVLDPELLEGQWGWEVQAPGEPLRFVARNRSRG